MSLLDHFSSGHPVGAWALFSAIIINLSTGSTQAATFTVVDSADAGLGSLRWALIQANNSATDDVINFSIGSGAQTISLFSSLPSLLRTVTIDGTTQPGYAGTPLIELNGLNSGPNAGLFIIAPNCVVRGLVVNRFDGGGIRLVGGGNSTVQGCYIGTDAAGTSSSANGEFGIWIQALSSGHLIGGTNSTQRNVIAGNTKAGIYVEASPNNTIRGNYIGLNAAGTASLTNGNNGIIIDTSGTMVVGGSDVGEGNVISGNIDSGIYVVDSTGATIQGNLIGLSAAASSAISNSLDGIRVEGGSGHLIGGAASGEGNVISGNGGAGVFLQLTSGCTVEGNLLGTDPSGTSGVGNAFAGVTLEGAISNVIGGTVAGALNVIAGNTQDGIYLTNSVANRIEGNWIGLDNTGDSALANGFNGITLESSTNNTVGGTVSGADNVISGNSFHGVSLRDFSTANTVSGNAIGLNDAGTAARPNADYGVRLVGSSNQVGGVSVAARNVISGNGAQGISVETAAAGGNVIQGNRIGTTAAGTAGLGNGNAGIGVSDAPGTMIGGTAAGAGNLISGNQDAGIFLVGAGTTQTLVQGNYIGTTADGNSAVPNIYEGIYLEDSSSNTIGGTLSAAGNLIAGNKNWGLFLKNTSGNVIQGNQIGIAANGVTSLGSKFHAIELETGAINNQIGGSAAGAGNTIANSLTVYSGVRVRSGATGNAIRGNAIYGNGGLGVDLGAYQTTLNDDCDPDTGANLLQNFPILTKAAVSSGGTSIQGDLNSITGQSYEVDFFASPAADPSGYGEGKIYLGSTTVVIPAGPNCTAHFVAGVVQPAPVGWLVSATATDPPGNTSEFSPLVAVEPYPLLGIAPVPTTSVALSWTNIAIGYVVDTATNLTSPITWSVVTNSPISTNGQWQVTLPIENLPERYFRLGLP